MPRKPVRDWITTKEAAEYLGLTSISVRQYLLRNKFPNAQHTGWAWSIPIADVKHFEQERIKMGLKNPRTPGGKSSPLSDTKE